MTRVAGVIDALRVAPGSAPGIPARDTRADLGLRDRQRAQVMRKEHTARIDALRTVDTVCPNPEPGLEGFVVE